MLVILENRHKSELKRFSKLYCTYILYPPALSSKFQHKFKPFQDSTFTSPRSLLAVIRLSTALARLRLSNTVESGDIDEAIRLLDVCFTNLFSSSINFEVFSAILL